MKTIVAALLLPIILLSGSARGQESPPTGPFNSISLGLLPEDFKKAFDGKTRFTEASWQYKPLSGDDDLKSAYRDIRDIANYMLLTPNGPGRKITAIFTRCICIAIIIEQDEPFNGNTIKKEVDTFLRGVSFQMPAENPINGKLLRSTNHEGKYVLRTMPQENGKYRLELLYPSRASGLREKTVPVKSKDGTFILTEHTASMKGNVRGYWRGKDNKQRVAALWKEPGDEIFWKLDVPEDNTYLIEITYGVTSPPMLKLEFRAGSNKFNWKVTDNEKELVFMKKALAKVKMGKGRQPFSIKLLDKGNTGTLQLHSVTLTPTETKKAPRTPMDEINEEIAFYRSHLEDQSAPKLDALKTSFLNKLDELGNLYKTKRNNIAGIAVKKAQEQVDALDILGEVKNSIAQYNDFALSKEQRDFPVDKSFLVGRWKDKNGTKEVEFRVLGKISVYRDGKRDMKANEDSYSFNEREESFSVISKADWFLYHVEIFNENLISLGGRKYERLETGKKEGEE